jgi:hypothetical protein
VGLAAPQVGVNVRLMVYNPVGERGQGEEYVLVNPQIVKYGKNQDVFAEGCLSFPTFGSDPKKAPTIEADVEVGFLTYSFPSPAPQPPTCTKTSWQKQMKSCQLLLAHKACVLLFRFC